MTTKEKTQPSAKAIAGIFWDGEIGFALIETDQGEHLYDYQGLSWLIAQCRKQGISCELYECAFQQVMSLTRRICSSV